MKLSTSLNFCSFVDVSLTFFETLWRDDDADGEREVQRYASQSKYGGNATFFNIYYVSHKIVHWLSAGRDAISHCVNLHAEVFGPILILSTCNSNGAYVDSSR